MTSQKLPSNHLLHLFEKFADYPALGRFAARDMGQTVAVGVVTDVKPKAKTIDAKPKAAAKPKAKK